MSSMSQASSHQALEFTPPSIEHLAQLLPSYQFEGLIATGGMGAVYKAWQTSLDRPVAIKVLPPELSTSTEFRDSFVTEAKLMARLNHANLISVFDCGEIDGMLYIVMEFVDGATLFQRTHGAHLSQEEALETIIAICRGLSNAHNAGILHRDIKPANIFITDSGIPKIGDFGLARPSGETESGIIFGTPGYTAPEVLQAPESVGPCSDVYSVGIMLYELLTAKLPNALYEPVNKYAQCDPQVDQCIRKAISANVDTRFQSAAELADQLEDILRKLKSPAKSPVQSRLNTAPTSVHTAPVTANKYVAPQKSNTPRNIFIILVLLIGIYGVLEWKKSKEVDHQSAVEHNKDVKPTTKAVPTPAKPLAPQDIKSIESTLNTLQRSLIAGDRPLKKLPASTLSLDNGQRLVLFIDKKLTWYQANAWATKYGAHLATAAKPADLQTLSKTLPENSTAWVGAATAGTEQWAWVDGTPWNASLKLAPSKQIAFVQINSQSQALVGDFNTTAPFFIEWKADGSMPAQVDQQMARAQADTSSFPAGSVSRDNRTYYLCPFPLTLKEARNVAKSAGAHIATPSNAEESAFINLLITTLTPDHQTCRLGATFKAKHWQWNNGEKWAPTTWPIAAAQENDTLAANNNKSDNWLAVPATEPTAFTLFEWSDDAPEQQAITIDYSTVNSPDLDRLRSEIANLIKAETNKKNENLHKNLEALSDQISPILSALSAEEQQPFATLTKTIQARAMLNQASIQSLPNTEIKQLALRALENQLSITSSFEESIDSIREVYQIKLESIIADLEDNNQEESATKLQEILDLVAEQNSADFSRSFL